MRHLDNWLKKLLLLAGLLEILAGLSHFAMPSFVYQARGFTLLNQDEINAVTLCILAVGILLIAFGALTLLFSFRATIYGKIILPYAIIKAILWLVRIILEFLFPLKISLFHLTRPTTVIMPLLILECLLFVMTAMVVIKKQRGMRDSS
jgi:amino acid transporter